MDINLIKRNICENTSAILFTNMFNNSDVLSELQELCKNRNILLIEDLAIYFGNLIKIRIKKHTRGLWEMSQF